jgi:hypothetical protein
VAPQRSHGGRRCLSRHWPADRPCVAKANETPRFLRPAPRPWLDLADRTGVFPATTRALGCGRSEGSAQRRPAKTDAHGHLVTERAGSVQQHIHLTVSSTGTSGMPRRHSSDARFGTHHRSAPNRFPRGQCWSMSTSSARPRRASSARSRRPATTRARARPSVARQDPRRYTRCRSRPRLTGASADALRLVSALTTADGLRGTSGSSADETERRDCALFRCNRSYRA